jgi:hypothetical protein
MESNWEEKGGGRVVASLIYVTLEDKSREMGLNVR